MPVCYLYLIIWLKMYQLLWYICSRDQLRQELPKKKTKKTVLIKTYGSMYSLKPDELKKTMIQ